MMVAFKRRAYEEDQGHLSRYWALCRALGDDWTGPPTVELLGDVLRFVALMNGRAKLAGRLEYLTANPRHPKFEEYCAKLEAGTRDFWKAFDALAAWLECSAAELLDLLTWASRPKGDTDGTS